MLVGGGECHAENGTVLSGGLRQQSQTVEGRQHAELELKFVIGGDLEWHPFVELIFGELNIESLLPVSHVLEILNAGM